MILHVADGVHLGVGDAGLGAVDPLGLPDVDEVSLFIHDVGGFLVHLVVLGLVLGGVDRLQELVHAGVGELGLVAADAGAKSDG